MPSAFLGRGIAIGISTGFVLVGVGALAFYFSLRRRRLLPSQIQRQNQSLSSLATQNPEPATFTHFIPAEMATVANVTELESPRPVLEMDEMGEAPRYTAFEDNMTNCHQTDAFPGVRKVENNGAGNTAGLNKAGNHKRDGVPPAELEGDVAWRCGTRRQVGGAEGDLEQDVTIVEQGNDIASSYFTRTENGDGHIAGRLEPEMGKGYVMTD